VVGVDVSDGWQRNDPDPALRPNVIRAVCFSTHEDTFDLCLARWQPTVQTFHRAIT
jgi:hypothetical protein